MIHFPKIIKSKIKDYSPLLTLSITSYTGEVFTREYYKVKYINKTELVFMTTNELDFNYNPRFLKDEFCIVQNFDQLVSGFENSEFVDLLTDDRFNGPPKYIYYDIILINEFLKQPFLSHLRESISGYTEEDFNHTEKKHLKKWLSCLTHNIIDF